MTTKVPVFERVPPQNVEAEMAVLGSMLIEEDAISNAVEILDGNSFYREAHAKIFEGIISLYKRNRAVDLVTLSDELKRNGCLDDVGGPEYLAQITSAVPTAVNVEHYAKIVKEKVLLRSLINAATQIAASSYDDQQDVNYLLDRAEQLIFEVATRRAETSFVPLRDIIKSSIENIDNLYQLKSSVTGLPTGFYDFDQMTAGLQPSDLVIVAGRPSMGKSALVICMAEYVAVVHKSPVAIFSLEMSKEQLVHRMLCSHARVDAHKARTGFLSQSDWPRLTNAAGKLSEASIFIDDTPGIPVLELRAKARRLKSRYNIELVIVDYLQLVQGPGKVESRQQEISEISRSLKALAKELKVPLIAVSQLSRAVESRDDRKPRLSDLRESGAIEQDADVVVLLLREEYYNPTPENSGIADVNIAKQRNGPVGSFNLAFIKELARFENLSERE
jgi:replicative DNA helicase